MMFLRFRLKENTKVCLGGNSWILPASTTRSPKLREVVSKYWVIGKIWVPARIHANVPENARDGLAARIGTDTRDERATAVCRWGRGSCRLDLG